MNDSVRNERELGQAIRALRLSKGFTQEQLAQKASVSRAFIIGLEKGGKPGAELSRVFRVLAALNQQLVFEEKVSLSFYEALQQLVGEVRS